MVTAIKLISTTPVLSLIGMTMSIATIMMMMMMMMMY